MDDITALSSSHGPPGIKDFSKLAHYKAYFLKSLTESDIRLLNARRETDDRGLLCAAAGVETYDGVEKRLTTLGKYTQQHVSELRGLSRHLTLDALDVILNSHLVFVPKKPPGPNEEGEWTVQHSTTVYPDPEDMLWTAHRPRQ